MEREEQVRSIHYDLLSGRKKKDEYVDVTPKEMWSVFLFSLNARIGVKDRITPKEVEVLSWILAQPYIKCYFSKPHKEQIMDQIPNLSGPELSRVKMRLLKINFVEEKVENGKLKTYPSSRLLKLRDTIINCDKVSFSFNMNLMW